MVSFPLEKIIRFLYDNVLGVFCVREKVFDLHSSSFFTPKRENPRDKIENFDRKVKTGGQSLFNCLF